MTRALYEQYLTALEATPPIGRFAPYGWSPLPDRLGAQWMAYDQMLSEFSRELANIINDLTHHVRRLEAWASVTTRLSNEDKLEATREFIDPLAIVAVGMPYAIRGRFAFATAHLCHQANQARQVVSWLDDLDLDHSIDMSTAEARGHGWKAFGRLKLRLEKINGAAFKRATHDFRHAYNHRFSPRFVIGLSQIVTRRVDRRSNAVGYAFGGIEPLQLSAVSTLLAKERDHCHAAFEAFQALVAEHAKAIGPGAP